MGGSCSNPNNRQPEIVVSHENKRTRIDTTNWTIGTSDNIKNNSILPEASISFKTQFQTITCCGDRIDFVPILPEQYL